MKLEVKKIIRPLNLSEYAEEYGGQCLQVWLNPPSGKMDAYFARLDKFAALRNEYKSLPDGEIARKAEIEKEVAELDAAAVAWMADLWNQGPEETRVSLEDVRAFASECIENDPHLWVWVQQRTLQMYFEHHAAEKKS